VDCAAGAGPRPDAIRGRNQLRGGVAARGELSNQPFLNASTAALVASAVFAPTFLATPTVLSLAALAAPTGRINSLLARFDGAVARSHRPGKLRGSVYARLDDVFHGLLVFSWFYSPCSTHTVQNNALVNKSVLSPTSFATRALCLGG
jgi:hypothetical protein